MPANARQYCLFGLFALVGSNQLVGHLEEQQHGELFHVLHADQPRLLQHAGAAPGAFADLRCIHELLSFAVSSWYSAMFRPNAMLADEIALGR